MAKSKGIPHKPAGIECCTKSLAWTTAMFPDDTTPPVPVNNARLRPDGSYRLRPDSSKLLRP